MKSLAIVTAICFSFMIFEFLGGYFSNSVAIMTDAAHMLSDVSGFIISILSICVSTKLPNNLETYGYHRTEVLGALTSILIIWALVLWLVFEAAERIDRILHHEGFEIDAYIMLYTSLISLACNVISLIALGHCGNSNGSVLESVQSVFKPHGNHDCSSHNHSHHNSKEQD